MEQASDGASPAELRHFAEEVWRHYAKQVWRHYAKQGRHDLPWRLPGSDGRFDPYKIMVSELMLQQTQVNRVVRKYQAFLERFPDVQSLAAASLGDVLVEWQGLGYNRRAKYLWLAAQRVVGSMGGQFPCDIKQLTSLPGVGVNTAGAIMAYAYDQPVVFVETNIRTVFIHHFFGDQLGVPDKSIEELVRQTLPQQHIRQWYWALMDYGTYIKQQHGNKARTAKAYSRQSPFQGSRRQVRGAVVRRLSLGPTGLEELRAYTADSRLEVVLAELVAEGMVTGADDLGGHYRLA